MTALTRKPYDLAVLVQVYAVALFVEAEPAAHELGIRHRGGFFQDNRCCVLYIMKDSTAMGTGFSQPIDHLCHAVLS